MAAEETSTEGVPCSGELDSIVVPELLMDSGYCPELEAAVETSTEGVPCSGELDSTVVPGALLGALMDSG